MKKLYLAALLLLGTYARSTAQVAFYQFTAVQGTFTPVSASATPVSAVVGDDVFSASIPIGFTFVYNGINYTSLFANSNGFLSFKATASATTNQQITNSAANVANVGPAVFPLWDDCIGFSTAPASSTAQYEVTGTPGSRVFTFEWKNWVWAYTSSNVAATISFQAKLYEGTNVIEFVYQQESNSSLNSPGATIGLGGATATDYLVLGSSGTAPVASSTTFTSTIAARPATSQVYRFAPPAACTTPSAQATAFSVSANGTTTASGSFTAANPAADRYLVVRTTTNTQPVPANGTTYTTGTSSGLGGYVESVSAATSFSSSGLTSGTQYYYWVFSYNSQCTGGPLYNATAPVTATATTGATRTSVASGDWNNTTTWTNGVIPGALDVVNIAAGNAVTLSAGTAVAATVATAATGSLTVSGGTLSVGGGATTGITNAGTIAVNGGTITIGAPGFNNRRFTNSSGGTLNVSSGTLNVYGNVAINNGSNLIQSGGLISVDGNNGGSTTNSVATGTPIFAIGTATTQRSSGTVSLTGGTLLIVDPHTGSSSDDFGFMYNGLVGAANNIVASANHTLQYGDGISTDAGGSATYQFGFNFWYGESAFTPGNFLIAALTGTNRTVRSRYTPYIIGNNLVVNSGEFVDVSSSTAPDNKLHLGGNIVVNAGGILTTGSSLALDAATYDGNLSYTLTVAAVTAARSISGTGIIRNSAASPTANFTGLFVNNTAGITVSRSISVSDSLKISTPVFNIGSDTVTVGTSATAPGNYVHTSGYIQGKLKRWINAAAGSRNFNLGIASGVRTAAIDFTVAPTTGGSLTAEWVSAAAGTNGLPLTEGPLSISHIAQLGFWRITAGNGLTGGTYTSTFTPENLPGVADYTQLVLLKRPDAATAWTLDGTHITTTGSNAAPVLSRSGLTSFSDFGIAGSLINPLPITLVSFNGSRLGAVNRLTWVTASETANKGFVLERAADGKNFKPIATIASKALNGNSTSKLSYSYDDESPLAADNYYRLVQTDAGGAENYSQTVLLRPSVITDSRDVAIYPNPVSSELNIDFTAIVDEQVQASISDVTGRVLISELKQAQSGANQFRLDVSKLPAGIYMLSTGTANSRQTVRFTKK